MNSFAYFTGSLAVKKLSQLSKLNIALHHQEKIPGGSTIFVANHFTRIETLFLPHHLYELTGVPVWSLADYSLFKGPLASVLDKVGAVSTRDPHRDLLMLKTLLTGEADWVIYPEGRMVKSKKIFEKGRYMVSYAGGRHPPHTGAATLALRTEFYRQRLKALKDTAPGEAGRLMECFGIESIEPVLNGRTHIVPINITYYPIRAHENIFSNLLNRLLDDISERGLEEVMAEGTMVLSGVDVDIRFGDAIEIGPFLQRPFILRDMTSTRRIEFDDPIPSRRGMHRIALSIMNRYMSSIYGMTTVNHDHLFASMLRAIPRRKIDETDFRRRTFLVANQDLQAMGIHTHRDLKGDQVHLVVDDRLHKYEDFLSLSIEKGVVEKEGNTLVRNQAKLGGAFNYHRIRIDNPVQVMANEVEPLQRLQRNVRRTARLPGFLVRRRIATRLMDRAVRRFEEDYSTFYVEGESKDMEIGRPFMMGGLSGKTGVVLTHGYMAAPAEVKGLAAYLARRGFMVYAPRLRGHGTSPDDLASRGYKEWVESVDEAYAIVNSLCRRVVAGGFSTGAGLALHLAARVADLAGVFAVSPPLRLQDFSARFLPAVGVWNRCMDFLHMDGAKKEFLENRPENPHINYFRNPVCGVSELALLMESVEDELHRIEIPALVIQAEGDPIVDPKGSKRVFELMSSTDKEYLLVNFDRHGILLGEGVKKVYEAVGNFVASVA